MVQPVGRQRLPLVLRDDQMVLVRGGVCKESACSDFIHVLVGVVGGGVKRASFGSFHLIIVLLHHETVLCGRALRRGDCAVAPLTTIGVRGAHNPDRSPLIVRSSLLLLVGSAGTIPNQLTLKLLLLMMVMSSR